MTRMSRVLLAVSLAALAAYAIETVSRSGSGAAGRDFTAFWAVTRELFRTGWSGLPHLYGAAFQRRAEAGLPSPGALPAIPFVNPPLGVLLVLPLAWLSVGAAAAAWDLVGLAALIAAALWLSGTRGLNDPRTAVALFAAAGVPTLSALGEAQYDLVLPLAVALAAVGARRHRWARLAIGSVVCTIKPELFLAYLVAAIRNPRRPAVRVAVAAVVAVAALSLLALGPRGVTRFVVLNQATLGRRFLPTHDSTILGELWNLVGGGLGAELAAGTLTLAGLVALWWAWGRWTPASQHEWWLALSAVACGSLLLAPHLFVHDLVLLVVPAGWVARARAERGQSLGPVVAWTLALDLAAAFDSNTFTANLPVKAVPIALLLATVALWRALAASRADAAGRAQHREAGAAPAVGAALGAG